MLSEHKWYNMPLFWTIAIKIGIYKNTPIRRKPYATKAIIFDMDGVIVDTEFLEYDLQAQFIDSIKEHNRTLTPLERSEVVGKGLAEIPEIVKKLSGSSFSLEEIKQRYFDFFKQLFATVDYLSIFRGNIHKIIDFAK